MPGKSRFGTTRQATHVHIQQVEPRLVIVLIAATVLPIDHIQRVVHLPDILLRTRIQCLLHHRLLRTRLASKGMLQGRIRSQARIDFYHPMGSGHQADKSVIELVHWCMFDSFLPNVYPATDRTKQIKLAQLHSQGCQTRSRAKMLRSGLKCFVVGMLDSFMVMLLLMKSFLWCFISYGTSPCFWQAFQGLAHISLIWAKFRYSNLVSQMSKSHLIPLQGLVSINNFIGFS